MTSKQEETFVHQSGGHRIGEAKEETMAFRIIRISTVDPQPVHIDNYFLPYS